METIRFRQNIAFIVICLILLLQMAMVFHISDQKDDLQQKLDSIEVRLDSINNELIILNEFLYD